jgi:hypothetical protein
MQIRIKLTFLPALEAAMSFRYLKILLKYSYNLLITNEITINREFKTI